MAIWQFQLCLIPAEWALTSESDVESFFSEDGFDTSPAWKEHPLKLDIGPVAEKLLPLGESWHKNLIVYGDLERTDVQIWKRDKIVESLYVRLDLRETSIKFLERLIDFANKLDCWFLFPDTKLLTEPNLNILTNQIKGSNSAKFVKDPEKFLRLINES